MKKPVVAIVGRPNVGKSTLFNRIIQRREAIVDDQPGITRDRKYVPAEWAGVEFMLLDTGGYVPASKDVFERAIRKQIELALNEAHLIIFVVDVTTGITSIDAEIANILKRSERNIILTVNKVDNEKREFDLYEFYNLGLGEPYPVSAINGRQTGDFLDKVVEYVPKQNGHLPTEDERVRIAVVGRPNVGKSSYVNALLGKSKMIVTEIPGTTRDSIDTEMDYNENKLVLIDTAGLRKSSRVRENVEYFSNVRTQNALRRCDVAVILIDAMDGLTDQDKHIIMTAIDAGKGIVLGVNKWDLVEKDTLSARRFEQEMQTQIRDLNYVPIIFISALTKQRVFRLVETATSVYNERKRKLKTSELNKFLHSAVEEHHPPAHGSKWVKLNYATQVRTEPPLFVFFTNEPKGIHKNYRNYLENRIRDQFGFFGVPIRMSFRRKSKNVRV